MKEYKSISGAKVDLYKYQNYHSGLNECWPENKPEFLDPFTYLLRHYDLDKDGSFEFDGEGYRFGKQIVISFDYYMEWSVRNAIEIAYDHSQCVIYTGNHNGYLVAPYASLSGADYADIRNLLFAQILKCVGIHVEETTNAVIRLEEEI